MENEREVRGIRKIIAVANQKGGVGKTSTCINLGASLAHFSQETLLIDIDPQANTTSGVGFDKRSQEKTLYQVLVGEARLEEVIHQTSVSWLDLIPAGRHLVGAEAELMEVEGRELILSRCFEQFNRAYRYLLIDCPPSLGLLTINALAAADSVLIPVQCEYYALEGLAQLLETVELVRERLNPRLAIEGVLFTMVDQRMNLTQQVIEEVKRYFGDQVFTTQIPRAVRVAEAPGFGKPLFLYDRYSKATEAYLQLAKEIIAKPPVMTEKPRSFRTSVTSLCFKEETRGKPKDAELTTLPETPTASKQEFPGEPDEELRNEPPAFPKEVNPVTR